MASIHRTMDIAIAPERAWDALRDAGALHTRLVAGFVTDCRWDPDDRHVRIVTFANGIVARERIVTIDDAARRIVWSAAGGRLSHHNASAQVFADGAAACRLVWIADLLPDEMAPAIAGMIEHGLAAMRHTLERAAA